MGLLDGKVAIVTGAARGVGRGTAMTLAALGAAVVVNDVGVEMGGEKPRHSEADNVVSEIKKAGGKASANYADVSNFKQVGDMVKDAVKKYGHVDIIVNNAGVVRRKLLVEMSEDDWDTVLDVHLKGTFNGTRWALPYMLERKWGRIVNTLSPAGIVSGSPRRCNYGSAKGGIYAFTQSIASEVVGTGVTCNCICPSTADTRLLRTSVEEAMAQGGEAEAFIKSIKPTPPEDVASVTAFMCTNEAAWVNGKMLYSNGGEVRYLKPIELMPLVKQEGRWKVEDLVREMQKFKGKF